MDAALVAHYLIRNNSKSSNAITFWIAYVWISQA
jgi:hypothetical protein